VRRLSIGLIGAGQMGRAHAENIAFRLPAARLTAVADVDRDRAVACAGRCGVAAVFQDYRELLAKPSLQAVVIATPPATHAEIVAAAAAAGKHIFCEKPLDCDLERVDRALAAVRTAGVKLQIGFHRRFDASFRRAREAVTSGEIGRPLTLRMTSRDPLPPPDRGPRPQGDLFLDTTIHDLDMARYITGAEAGSVFVQGGIFARQPFDDPDTAVTVLHMSGGAVCTIDNSRLSLAGYDQRLEVFGERGTVTVENQREHETIVRGPGGPTHAKPQPFFVERYAHAYAAEMAAFVECVLESREPPVTGEDGRAAVVLALAALQSYREGRVVRVSEIV
jgi:myo-inositol 2-dehydrogenase/D-chiro-inositol 1-dehydrogenase